jgi:putative pyruvate formate lyase activating enzyme
VAHIGPHFGEEPVFSGARGSGTVFFTGCSTGCFFCQNIQISRGGTGDYYTIEQLTMAAEQLVNQGVHNINLVTPDHFWPHVQALVKALRERNIHLPVLFNGSGYQRADLVTTYAEIFDVFMPDFKFIDPDLAERCMGDQRYPEIALEAIRQMIEAKGFLQPWDPSGQRPATEGVLVRHLVLPGHVGQSLQALERLHREFGRLLPLSVMSQYHPMPACHERGQLTRPLRAEEFKRVVDRIHELEFKHVFIQEIPDTTDFLPDFEREEPFKGNRHP